MMWVSKVPQFEVLFSITENGEMHFKNGARFQKWRRNIKMDMTYLNCYITNTNSIIKKEYHYGINYF